MTYKAKYQNKFVPFYPIVSNFPVEEFDIRNLENMPEKIFGKLLIGMAGYNPIWLYKTVQKTELALA